MIKLKDVTVNIYDKTTNEKIISTMVDVHEGNIDKILKKVNAKDDLTEVKRQKLSDTSIKEIKEVFKHLGDDENEA